MALLNPAPAGDPPANDPPAPPAGDPPANDPPANEPAAGERPDWIPESAWKDGAPDLGALKTVFDTAGKAQDLPASADAYAMPAIEGFDSEKAKDSPLFKALRTSAFGSGMGQAAFDTAIKSYVQEMTTDATASEAKELAALGSNANDRIKAVENWVSASLPADEAAAVMAGATTASAVVGLEKLMNLRAGPKPPAPPPPAATRKTAEEIRTLMASPQYHDVRKRDPAVVAEVEAWYKAEAEAKKAAQPK